jgi:hypothetical protein
VNTSQAKGCEQKLTQTSGSSEGDARSAQHDSKLDYPHRCGGLIET